MDVVPLEYYFPTFVKQPVLPRALQVPFLDPNFFGANLVNAIKAFIHRPPKQQTKEMLKYFQ